MLHVFIWAFLGWGGNAIVLCALGDHRYKGWRLAGFWCLVVLGNAAVTALLYRWVPSGMVIPAILAIAMVLELVPYLCTTRGHWGKRAFFALNCTCVAAVIGVITLKFFSILSLEGNVIKIALCLLIAVVYRVFAHKPIETITHNLDRHWLWINGMGAVFSAMFYYNIVGYINNDVTLLELCGVMVMNLAVYVGMFYTIHFMSLAIHLAESQLQEEILLGQVQRLMDAEEQAKVMRHDLRHHNQALTAFVQQKQYQALEDYLADYNQSIIGEGHQKFCANPLVDNVLWVYHCKAQQAGVSFAPNANVGVHCPVKQRDLVALLSNLLENALNGCDGAGEINIKLSQKGEKLVIVCKNTALTPVMFQKGIPQSKNRQSSGMTSVLRTVNCYDGMADFRQEQGVFTACVYLKLEEQG